MRLNISHAIADASKLLSGNLVAKLIGIAALMVYTRILSKEQLAAIPIYFMLSSLAGLFFSFGILPTIVRRLPSLFDDDLHQAKRILFTATMLIVGGTALVSVITVIFDSQIASLVLDDASKGTIIILMTCGFVPVAIDMLTGHVLWARAQFKETSLLQVFDALVRPVFSILLFLKLGLVGLVSGLVLTHVLKSIISIYCIRDIFKNGVPSLYPPGALIKESLPFYLESYLMYFRREGDNWLVTTLLGPAVLAIYYVAKTIYGAFYMMCNSVDKVVVQRLAKNTQDKTILMEKAQQLQISLAKTIIPVILLTISILPLVIPIIASQKYIAAVLPASFLLVAVLIEFLRLPSSRTLFVAAPPVYRLYATTFETAWLLAGLILLIPLYGAVGVAGARVLAQIAAAAFGLGLLWYKFRLSLPFQQTALVLISAFPGTIVILSLQQPVPSAGQAILFTIFYAGCWFLSFVILSYFINREMLVEWQKLVLGLISHARS